MLKQSKIIVQHPKTLKKPNIVDIRSVIIQHPKTTHKLPKAIKQTEKVCQVNGAEKSSDRPWYSEKKRENFFEWKKIQE